MAHHTLRIGLAAALAACGLPAAANGINPPQLSAQVVMSAACTPRQPGEVLEIHRVKVAPGADAGALVLMAPGAEARPVPMAQVERLVLPESTADGEGFGAARVRMRADGQEQDLRIALAQAGEPVQLRGFSATGKAAAVSLASCSELVFSAPAEAAPPANGGLRAN